MEQLSKEQLDILLKVRERSVKRCVTYKKIDEDRLKRDVKWLYRLAGYDAPEVVVMDSWAEQQLYVNKLVKDFNHFAYDEEVGQNICSEIRNRMINLLMWAGKKVSEKIGHQLQQDIWSHVGDYVRRRACQGLNFDLGSNVVYQIGMYLHEQLGQWINFSNPCCNIMSDMWTIAPFEAVQKLKLFKPGDLVKVPIRFKSMFLNGVSSIISLEHLAVVSRMPRQIIRDGQGRLHSWDGPAIKWLGRHHNYFVEGNPVNTELWKKIKKGEFGVHDAMRISDIEERAEVLKILGPDRFFKESHAKCIDATERNNLLYQCWFEDREFRMLRYECPSTGKTFTKFVPETFRDADVAQAWCFGLTLDEYYAIEKET